MNKLRHTILATKPGLCPRLQKAAQQAKVTVDAVVQAGLDRKPVSEAALIAARKLAQEDPDTFKRLDAWPYTCQFCFRDIANIMQLKQCPMCNRQGCKQCVTKGMCPKCTAIKVKAAEAAVEKVKLRAEIVKSLEGK
jgi:hypothetical protein